MARRYTQQEKTQALETLAAGRKAAAVAAEFGISTSTLRRWAKAAVPPESVIEGNPAEPLQLVVIDTAGDTSRIARILRNERLRVTVTRLPEHAYAEQVASHFSWRHHSCVLDLDEAGVRRVFDLLQRSGRPLPRVLVSRGGQFPCSDSVDVPDDTAVIDVGAPGLLGALLDREYQLAGQRARMADYETHIRQLHECYQRAFDACSEPFAIIGSSGHRYANPAYLRLFECQALADVRDAQFTRLIADRSMQDYLEVLDRLKKAGATTSLDIALLSGARAHVEVTRLPGPSRELQLRFQSMSATRSAPVLSRPGSGDIARSLAETTPLAEKAQPVPKQKSANAAQWNGLILRALQDPNLFSLLYQPIVGLSDGPSGMYEALLRMRDSTGAEYLPGKFMPAAEEAGLMLRIDQWVIARAIEVIKTQSGQDLPVTICVNLSPVSLLNKVFPDWLRNTIDAAGIDTGRLVMEISRADLVRDLPAAQRALSAIRAIGCALVLDDFGIESADSGLLSKVSVDFVKIDRTLVQEVARSDVYLARIQTLVKAAETAGVKTIAAYVQEAASVSRLWSCGIDYVQGYFLQHPSHALDYDFDGEEHEVPATQWALLV